MVKQAMVSEVHMDLGMEAVGMIEGTMIEDTPRVMYTATGVQHQPEKQPTPGLALSGIMDVLQLEQLGRMIGRQAACHPGSKQQHSTCDRAAQHILMTTAGHVFVSPWMQ